MTTKHTIDSFFVPASRKKARMEEAISKPTSGPIGEVTQTSRHLTYPFPIPHLSPHITDQLAQVPASTGKEVSDQADLDLLYFQPYIPKSVERDLFLFLRRELFFYRVQYKIKRGGIETDINTPRYTTVFGVDKSSTFTSTGDLVDSRTSKRVPRDR